MDPRVEQAVEECIASLEKRYNVPTPAKPQPRLYMQSYVDQMQAGMDGLAQENERLRYGKREAQKIIAALLMFLVACLSVICIMARVSQ